MPDRCAAADVSVERVSGHVVRLTEPSAPGAASPSAELEIEPVSACRRCAEGRGCGAGLLGAAAAGLPKRLRLDVGETTQLQPGDDIVVEVPAHCLRQAAVNAYGLPLAGLLSGALLAAGVASVTPASGDATGIVCALGGLLLGMALSRLRLGRAALSDKLVLKPGNGTRAAKQVPTIVQGKRPWVL